MLITSRRQLLAFAAAFAATPVLAQTPPPMSQTPSAAAGLGATQRVQLTTPLGLILIDLAVEKAPITAGNFLTYVGRRLYDGASFYRASKPPGQTANDYGVVQGGLQNDPKRVLPPIAHESTSQTGLKHLNGTISMGRNAPGTAQADWFICVGDQAYLDATETQPGFAAFGRVAQGMDVVQAVLGQPVDPTRGEGVMRGEMLQVPVPISAIRHA
jgi:peptidyl-prolyl cis-trans isomerase A (cyclophilin A)